VNGPVRSYPLSQPLGKIWGSPSNTSISLKSTWVTLPPEFNSTTAGLVLLFPPVNNTVKGRAISCSIDARWAQGRNWAINSDLGSWQWETSNHLVSTQSLPLETRYFPTAGTPDMFLPKNDSSWRRIQASTGYFEGTTPQIDNQSATTSLESILMDGIATLFSDSWTQDFSNSSLFLIPFIEHIIATVVADSIARTGSYLQQSTYDIYGGLFSHPGQDFCDLQSKTAVNVTSLEPYPSGSAGSSPMIMKTSVEGYAYVISGFTMYIAVISLMSHVIMALMHIALVLRTRRTSAALSRIPELVVLAQNSRPAAVLQNTAGGIGRLKTYGITGKVEVTDGENLELLWRDSEGRKDEG